MALTIDGGITFGGGISVVIELLSGSLQFNGTSQYLSVPSNAGFGFGTGDFTIECWINPSELKLADVYIQVPGGTTFFLFGLANTSGPMRCLYNNGTSFNPVNNITTANGLISINTWYHTALMRSGSTISLFIDGVCRGTRSGASTFSMGSGGNTVEIAGTNLFPGLISNMRVVKGSTVYAYGTTVGTTYFTPPTTPLADDVAGTQLLLNTPNDANFLKDSSPNDLTIVNNGSVTSSALNPFY